ncbi:MAG: uL15 family ribosomal protein [Candidatus Marsarchaeota archaeon]|jgi:large subunit ribosomal protein L15|nr:uL15 family ribosomal protein [Candidatus Marsarchaeota archaeon]MCL5419056.1 uL15 family ribosomal protein [Candidatus Marsarchaeota archaeon]
MVVRHGKRNRKYFGTRRWGAGNIKNARGAGDRGGVGKAGARKHKFTHMTAKEPWLKKSKGFAPWRRKRQNSISLDGVNRLAMLKGEEKPTVELKGYKVLSNGTLEKPAVIKASAFSKGAAEKIKKLGGEAIVV